MSTPQDANAVPGLDARAAQRWLGMPRVHSPWLHEEVASRMVQRLGLFREQPASWLHWEPMVGGLQAHRLLRERLPLAACHVEATRLSEALDATREPAIRSWNPLHWQREQRSSPLGAGEQVGMVWANMSLHHEPMPLALLKRWHSLIQTNGFLMFSCLGPDTLRELRSVFALQGWPDPAHAFTDMHDWGDMLVQSGFAEPVMDMERITLSYSSAETLLQELRELGRNLHSGRFGALRGRAWHTRLVQALERDLPRGDDGRLLLTFEIIYGHAFKPLPRVPLAANQSVSVDQMRAMLKAGRG
ncbi:MAG: biotin synthase [Hydrogenophaga sp.]|nr:biotin synthase [Hydrogenophaga sp.]